MSIPANIAAELSNLQAQVAANIPIANAPFATIKAMQLNAAQLVGDINSALTAVSMLDTWAPPADPISMVMGFDNIVVAGADQSTLALMRGLVGRVASNLDQLGVQPMRPITVATAPAATSTIVVSGNTSLELDYSQGADSGYLPLL